MIYSHGARVEPKRFNNFKDIEYKATLKKCLQKDFLWSLVHGLPENLENPSTGSWTVFNRDTSCCAKEKSIIQYEPQIMEKPSLAVCKFYLDSLLETCEDLGLHRIFSHSDEDIYCKILQILWKNDDLYNKIKPLMGGFHELRVRQRLISKRHGDVGYQR